jgi:hypothetical protein
MAICVIGGLITSTMLTLVVVPVAYSLTESMIDSSPIRWLSKRIFGDDAQNGGHGSAAEVNVGSGGQ